MKRFIFGLIPGLIVGTGLTALAATFTLDPSTSLMAICQQLLAPTSVPTTPVPPPSTGNAVTLKAYITGYAAGDNSPAGDGTFLNGVEGHAGGTGTYSDPITVAVGYVGSKADYAYGTVFYVPNFQRYFKAQDTCADCHTVKDGQQVHLDLYAGNYSGSGVLSCEDSFTGDFTVLQNPPSNLKVSTGTLYSGSKCTAQFGNALQ